jgi:hypothetical protein
MNYEPPKGCNFYEGVKLCKEEAIRLGQSELKMQFNEIELWVNITSYIDDLARIYELQRKVNKLENA